MQTISQTICGPWRLVREIGRGAYGTVYLAEKDDGERAAVKVCRCDDIGKERYARELRGAKLYSAIPHQEGLVRMRELAEESWGFYAVMDLADDEFDGDPRTSAEYHPKTLARVIEGEKALPLGVSVKLGIALAKGLASLQRHPLLHRDIKPGHVIYVGERPVLSDPGLVVEDSEAASLVGTPGYVPPENFTDAVGDIYSLGLTLKAASFGRHLEDLSKGPALEADTGTKFFPAWWRILNKATDPTPSRRYQSAKALLKDLEGLRRKIVVSTVIGTRAARVAIALVAFSIVALVVLSVVDNRRLKNEVGRQSVEAISLKEELAKKTAELEPLKRLMSTMQALNDMSAQDDTAWSSFNGSYYCHTDESHRQRLQRAAEKDPVRAATMRDILNQMQEIDKKGEENNRRIKVLRDKAKSGQEASESYNQAELLSMENEKLTKAWLSLLERFTEIEDAVKMDK